MADKSIIILGNFDGVHLGHRALINEGRRQADEMGLPLIAWTFDTLPAPAVTSVSDRGAILRSHGVDRVVTENFLRVKDLSCQEFVCDILDKRLNCAACICGYNYTFGRGGVGTSDTLSALCSPLGIGVTVVNKVTLDNEEVSSTRVRALLSEGNVKRARDLMDRYYFLSGAVQKGARKGRTVGMPTANLYPVGLCLPKNGVYATITSLPDGRRLPSVTNIGTRPTLNDGRGVSAETHIIGFDGDLYGKKIRVDFIDFIRDERPFPSLSSLSEAVKNDTAKAEYIAKKAISKEKM